jgi:hypothetical protein
MSYSKSDILSLLATSDKAVLRAIVVIHALQTADEQKSQSTSASNGVGFGYRDAEFGSSLAEKINKGYRMSEKQINAGRRMISHYHRQLVLVANGELEVSV